MHTKSGLVLGLVVLAVLGLAAIAADDDAVARGRRIFFDSGEDLEWPSCAHCHATVAVEEEAQETGHIRPAYPVFNTAHRGAWKNKPAGKGPKTAGDAGNICVRAFQKRKPLPPAQLADLNAFLESVSPSTDVQPRKIRYKPPLPEELDGGDAEEGPGRISLYCAGCHGDTSDHIMFKLEPKKKWKKLRVARKVRGYTRAGKWKANNGMMSFFARGRLPDADLKDILAYLAAGG
ncbi:MAG: c-type cytochrome [Planctomycetota bacterium]